MDRFHESGLTVLIADKTRLRRCPDLSSDNHGRYRTSTIRTSLIHVQMLNDLSPTSVYTYGLPGSYTYLAAIVRPGSVNRSKAVHFLSGIRQQRVRRTVPASYLVAASYGSSSQTLRARQPRGNINTCGNDEWMTSIHYSPGLLFTPSPYTCLRIAHPFTHA